MVDFTGIMRAFGITAAVSSTRSSEVFTRWALCAKNTDAVRHFVDSSTF